MSALLRALIWIIVADARRKGVYCDLYLGSIKLPDPPPEAIKALENRRLFLEERD